MNIGELAQRSGLSASRIRYYESIGLLKAARRRANGYRTYPPEAVLVLDVIASAQRAGFSLDEIRALLPADLERWQHDALIDALRRKVRDVEALQARLAQSRAHLVALIHDIESRPGDIDCAANARRVLSRIRQDRTAPAAATAGGAKPAGKPARRRPAPR